MSITTVAERLPTPFEADVADQPALLDHQRWAAVLGRDRSWDGRFVMAVSSTGIYCRPSCPARRPARERVRFYEHPEQARAAGYRACRRCLPDLGADSPSLQLVRRACAILDEPPETTPTLADLGRRLGVSPSHLQRTFTRITGISPRAYADARRQRLLRERLRSQLPVTDAIYEAGFGSGSRVYETSDAQLGMSPGIYRNGASGAAIRYTILDTALGAMLVAATERGLCRVTLGESADALELSLGEEFPAASRTRDDEALASMAAALVARTEGREPAAELPLDIRATAFQRQVWETLRRIPTGSTRSYSQVAASIGRPGAARAVARACASNPVAIAIPCHRVVRGNGQLGGYRWGIERKRRLLEIESAG